MTVRTALLHARLAALLLAIGLALPSSLPAGGGPQNLLLVVNPRSWSSLTVANHYIQLRQIPPSHVLYLDWQGSPLAANADEFRQQILEPVMNAINSRGLADQIDYVAYSSDFPYRIDASADVGGSKAPTGFAPTGTLTSFTYLWQLVEQKQADPRQLESNQYFSRQPSHETPPPSRAFRRSTGWDARGQQSATGMHYLLSTMLAMTSGRGNSATQAVSYLTRSAQADGTLPRGTIYYCRTKDVRTQVRTPLFGPAVLALRDLGVRAEIIDAALPLRRNDVQGLTLGAAKFDWSKSGSTLLPGAICDNLTSTSAFLLDTGNQTAMTEFLAAGAAGASGTVIEPGAIVNKFPSPFIHVHYARGNTLAEAYYQSVHAPFQLLIVGDPLCKPWAQAPQVTVSGVQPGATISGEITLQPNATTPDGSRIRQFELLVDGRRIAQADPGAPLTFDSTSVLDGYHELTAVAIVDTPIEVQGQLTVPVLVANGEHAVKLASIQPRVAYGRPLKLTATASGPNAAQVMLFQTSRGIARENKSAADFEIDNRILGLGPSRLQAVALDSSGKPIAISEPLGITIDPPPRLRPQAFPQGKQPLPGLELTLANGRKVAARDTAASDWLERLGVGRGESYKLSGYLDVPTDDVYQFVFTFAGELNIAVNGQSIFRGSSDRTTLWRYVPVSLAAGTHFVEISGTAKDRPRLQMRFGGPGAWWIGERQFRHAD